MKKMISVKKKKRIMYQHMRCAFWIFVAAIIMLGASLVIKTHPWDSICQNVFAGLLTGLVVTLIGSIKNKSLKDKETEYIFLDKIHSLYLSSFRAFLEFRWGKNLEAIEYDRIITNLLFEAQAVEEYIESCDNDVRLIHILGKKPSEFFNDETDYNLSEQKYRYEQLSELLELTTIYDEKFRKKVNAELEIIGRAQRTLFYKIMNYMREIDKEKKEIETSIP